MIQRGRTSSRDDGGEPSPDGRHRSKARFAYPPQLLLLDGGKGQLGVGVRVLEELGLSDKVAVASLAKQLEEVFVPGRSDPVQIPRDSEAIYLLQQARDEAHRFAISFHRELRGKRMTRGALDGIAGLGPARRRRLISEMGGVRAVQAASLDDLLALGLAAGGGWPQRVRAPARPAGIEGRMSASERSLGAPRHLVARDVHERGGPRIRAPDPPARHLAPRRCPSRARPRERRGSSRSRLVARQHETREIVVGLEPSVAQLAAAAEAALGRDGAGRQARPRYVRGVGERLPFRDGAFDGVVCCLVIEHALDPDAVLAEAVRVLAVGGRFILLVNHPMFQGTGSGFVDDQILGEHYWRVGPYLHEDVVFEEVDPGVRLPFAHRPLSRYVNPVTALGCVLTRLEEPEPPLAFLEGSVDLELESAIPRLAAVAI